MQLADLKPSFFQDGVRSISPLDIRGWDEAIGAMPHASFFHTQAWVRVLHDTYGYRPCFHVLQKNDRTLALLPVMEVNSWLTGRRGIGLPFTDQTEPLCPDETSFQQLFRATMEFGKARRWKYLELRGYQKFLPHAPVSTSYWSHTLNLNPGAEKVFSNFQESVRRAIRKAERTELRLEFSQNIGSMHAFYGLLGRTRRRHGVPPQPLAFFSNIQRHVLSNGKGWIVLAYKGTTPIAGGVFFHFGADAIYKFGASDETQQHLRANNLVMWGAIQHYLKAGLSTLDLGRTSLANDGLRAFKRGWGTTECQIGYFRYDSRGNTVTVRDEAQGWHNVVFRNLPEPASRLAGAMLYKHIA